MGTDILIDDELMQKAMSISGHKTQGEVIKAALTEFIASHSRKNLLDLRGKVQFADDYDYKGLREGR